MTILSSLMKAYGRLPDAPPPGYSFEGIGFVISLDEDGNVVNVIDCREGDGKKAKPKLMLVPQPAKRTNGINPSFLWDKASYVLGVSTDTNIHSVGEDETDPGVADRTAKETKRAADNHRAFVDWHQELIGESEDPGLKAFKLFLHSWNPERFTDLGWPDEMKGQNIVFALEADRLKGIYLHDREAAKALWQQASSGVEKTEVCLVTGERGVIARLHRSVKGVSDARSSGASLVSFNEDAFESYGRKQGENAPVSEDAAFAYTTALNCFLKKDSGHRLQIGDASTVFWADASDRVVAEEAEALFSMMFEADEMNGSYEQVETSRIRAKLDLIRNGVVLEEVDPRLSNGVDFYILGLSPNSARVSVRFFYVNDIGDFARNYQQFVADTRIDPPPRDGYPPLQRYLRETAVLRKPENIMPNLAGEWMRSILTGTNYPLTLMSSVLGRIRADGNINPLRVGILKAVLVRNFKRENTPVAFDPTNTNRGYLLGRLFAVYEKIQTAALGREINATIKDKFYGSASAQPRKVFHVIERGASNHLSKLGKLMPGYRVTLEKEVSAIMDLMTPGQNPFPVSLSAEEQALFALGYYHQRNEFFKKKS